MSDDYEALVADAQRMQHALLRVRRDLQQMLDRRLRINPSATHEGLKTLASAAMDCWNILQTALATEKYDLLDAAVSRVTNRMQKMAEAMRKAAAAVAVRGNDLRSPRPRCRTVRAD